MDDGWMEEGWWLLLVVVQAKIYVESKQNEYMTNMSVSLIQTCTAG